MAIDSTFRAIAAIACLYTIGLFVTVTSSAALNSVAQRPGAICAEAACSVTSQHHALPSESNDYAYSHVIHTAALFLAGE